MKITYSKKQPGFYVSGVSELPEDATEISQAEWMALLDGQAAGKMIDFSATPPVLKEYVKSPAAYVAEAETLKQSLANLADTKIAPLQYAVELGIATNEEAEKYNQWRTYRVLLNRTDAATAPDIDWPTQPT
ncbi:tail fiber assembly protein [Mixta calida]|uniref:tail fiber assembly protein n=1 Tax=Mixta calida TaxID=665913 RepID=UPI002FD993B6